MIKIMKSSDYSYEQLLERTVPESPEVDKAVAEIISNVITYGDKALKDYALRFDKATLESLEVTKEEINEALATVDTELLETMKQAHKNIADFHKKQLYDGFKDDSKNGIVVGQRVLPLERVGVYVPGGTASYPSTVLMNVVPAKIAGVKEVCVTTPPDSNGKIPAPILAAASISGADRIFKVGGAGAVAAYAYGTETIPVVDKIVGPGNVFVATAKRMVFGKVAIDMIAGPSEILIIADEGANAKWMAADMLSQAEHDRLSSSVLITTSEKLADEVASELEIQLNELPRKDIATTSIENNGKIIITDTLDTAIELANAYAPEHLELAIANPMDSLCKIINAGSVFLGYNAPEALGDYFAGPNHTLPTSGTARFASQLGTDDFLKRSSFIYYSSDSLNKVGTRIVSFAEAEGLHAHGKSISVRLK